MKFHDTIGTELQLGDHIAVASRDKRIGLVIGSIIRIGEKSITIQPLDPTARAYVVPARPGKAKDILLVNELFV